MSTRSRRPALGPGVAVCVIGRYDHGPHSREEEGFYILEGEITIQVGDERFVAVAGTFANMPVGSLHSFKNESEETARLLITVAPAGLEQMFSRSGSQSRTTLRQRRRPRKRRSRNYWLLLRSTVLRSKCQGISWRTWEVCERRLYFDAV
jgi:hypothetical protein